MNLFKEVHEIMTSDLTIVSEETPVSELKNKFKRRGIHHILVENIAGKLTGIISTEDVARTAHFSVPDDKLAAKHIMTASPVKVTTDTLIKNVIDQFLENHFRAIPVVNKKDVLVGIVTPYDIMAELSANTEHVSIF